MAGHASDNDPMQETKAPLLIRFRVSRLLALSLRAPKFTATSYLVVLGSLLEVQCEKCLPWWARMTTHQSAAQQLTKSPLTIVAYRPGSRQARVNKSQAFAPCAVKAPS